MLRVLSHFLQIWNPNGLILFSSMHQDNHGYICLLIQGATKEDAGWYTVSAKNEAGIVSCTARLDVYSECHSILLHLPITLGKPGICTANHITAI